jgi:hypothetical protein
MGKVTLFRESPDIALVKVDAKTFLDHALEIDAAPAHDTVPLPIRSGVNNLGELRQLLGRKTGLGARLRMVEEAFRSVSVEAMNPITQCPPLHAAGLGGFGPKAKSDDR